LADFESTGALPPLPQSAEEPGATSRDHA
jgi:hypothetical protein